MIKISDTELIHALKMARVAIQEAENNRQTAISDYSRTKMIILSMTDVRALMKASEEVADSRNILVKTFWEG